MYLKLICLPLCANMSEEARESELLALESLFYIIREALEKTALHPDARRKSTAFYSLVAQEKSNTYGTQCARAKTQN